MGDTRLCSAADGPRRGLLDLPAEIRINILEYVFDEDEHADAFTSRGESGEIVLNDQYRAADQLRPLLVSRQMYADGHALGMPRTCFVFRSLSFNVSERLYTLPAEQAQRVRAIAYMTDARLFHKMLEWTYPFGVHTLTLDTLTIVLYRSSPRQYRFENTVDFVQMLRRLTGVRRLVFVRNRAAIKGGFRAWYNRLVGLMMKIDHFDRYIRTTPTFETTWWRWSFDELAQTFCLDALPPRPLIDEDVYLKQMMPLMDDLRISVENDESQQSWPIVLPWSTYV